MYVKYQQMDDGIKPCECIVKLMLIGDSGAGKTSLLMKYAVDTFSPTYISTIGIDFKIKHITINNSRVKLQIWDTAGQERFRTITTAYYRGSQGVAVIYDVTDRESFTNVERWLGEIDKHAPINITKVLIGNKSDMIDRRVISTKEGQELAKKHNIKFFETSAKEGTNVNNAFDTLAHVAYSVLKARDDPNIVIIPPNVNPKRSKCC